MSDYQRLSKVVHPIFYDISIAADLNFKTFSGVSIIEIEINEPIDSFQIHAHNIVIKSAIINENCLSSVTYLKDLQKIELKFDSKLLISKNILKLEYEGQLSTSMKGFYLSSYTCGDGSIESMAVTHFEPTNARHAFPCWDEPIYRTPFKITIICVKGYSAISNMPVKNHIIDGSMEKFEFDITPIMSTYLVAFAIGKFDQKKLNGTNISVYCRKDTPDNLATFALDVADKAINFYNKWFDIEYNLPKLDMLAVPDFQGGAMENWGLVTFRERALLVSDQNTSIAMKQRVALTITHELAHMWFGNLVTMEWWTDLWLKEGFATWIEYLCVDHCFPNYDIWTQFVGNEYFRTLKLDSLINTHPIEVEVKSPDEISEIFDTISYSKGASVIRMLYDYLGKEDFQKGLRAYLKTYKFKCTKTEDLWNSLQTCTHKSVKEVMNSWTQQSGYPFLKTEIFYSESDNNVDSIKLIQERYFQSGDSCHNNILWNIPITIVSAENPREEIIKFVMTEKEHVFDFTNIKKRYHSIYLNPNATGIYRVKYTDKNTLDSIKKYLSFSSWSSSDKYNFIDDCFSLANSGHFLYTDILDMLDFMKVENSYILWQLIDSNLRDIHHLLEESVYGVILLDKFIIDLASPIYEKLGWNETQLDSHNDILLRPLIISLLSMAKHSNVILEARKLYNNLIDKGDIVHSNIRGVMYSIVCIHSTEKEFHQLTNRFLSSISEDEKNSIINSLGKVPIEYQEQFKNWLLSDKVRKQDKLTGFISASCTSHKHREYIWNLMKSQWNDIREMFSGQFLMGHLLNECLGRFSCLTKITEIEEFFKVNDSTSPRNVKQALEKIKNNNKRMKLHVAKVNSHLVAIYGNV